MVRKTVYNNELELINSCGELVADNDPRLEPKRDADYRYKDSDVYLTKDYNLAYRIYNTETDHYDYRLFIPMNCRDLAICLAMDDSFKEDENRMRREMDHRFYDDKGGIDEDIDPADMEVFRKWCRDQGEDNLDLWDTEEPERPECSMVRWILEENVTEDQKELFRNIYGLQRTQSEVAGEKGVKPSAIGNQVKRLKDAIRRRLEEYGVTGDTFADYEAQMHMLDNMIATLPTETAGELVLKYRMMIFKDSMLKKRLGAFKDSLSSLNSLRLTGMPHGKTLKGSRLEQIVCAKIDTEKSIVLNRKDIEELKITIDRMLKELSDDRYRTVILKRDINGHKWDDVSKILETSTKWAQSLYKKAIHEANEIYRIMRTA